MAVLHAASVIGCWGRAAGAASVTDELELRYAPAGALWPVRQTDFLLIVTLVSG